MLNYAKAQQIKLQFSQYQNSFFLYLYINLILANYYMEAIGCAK